MTTKASPPHSALPKARVYGPDGSSSVKCDCCGESALAFNYYYGLQKCSKGGPSKEFIAKFKVMEQKVEPKKGQKKKSEAASSKASTPVKDTAANEDEAKEDAPKSKSRAKDNKKADSHDEVEDEAEDAVEKPTKSAKKQKVGKSTSKTTKAASEETAEDKPKRGANPYMLFSQANRASVLAETPEMKMTEISKVIGAKWRALSAEEKAEWSEKAAALKGTAPAGKGKGGKEKAPSTRTKSAYMLWSAEERKKVLEEQPDIKPKDIYSVLAERWKAMSAEDKEPYEQEAAELRDAAHTRADAEDEEEDAKAAAPAQKRKRLSKGEDSDEEAEKSEAEDKEEKASPMEEDEDATSGKAASDTEEAKEAKEEDAEEEEAAAGTQEEAEEEA